MTRNTLIDPKIQIFIKKLICDVPYQNESNVGKYKISDNALDRKSLFSAFRRCVIYVSRRFHS